MSTADLQLRRTMRRLLVLQLFLTVFLAAAAYAWHGLPASRAALFGGAVAMAGTLVILWYGRRAERAGANLARNASLIYGSAIVRFATTITLLAVGIATLRLQPLWLFAGLSAGLLAQLVLTALIPETRKWRAKR
jgi:F0F1-type ATP synthase assembly protein I